MDNYGKADALVQGGQMVEVLAFEDPGLVRIRFWNGGGEYEGRILATELVGVKAKEGGSTAGGSLLTPDPDNPITFLDTFGDNTREPIYVPTRIEIDPRYPDKLEGWENVEVKILATGQEGLIYYGDLKKYL